MAEEDEREPLATGEAIAVRRADWPDGAVHTGSLCLV